MLSIRSTHQGKQMTDIFDTIYAAFMGLALPVCAVIAYLIAF